MARKRTLFALTAAAVLTAPLLLQPDLSHWNHALIKGWSAERTPAAVHSMRHLNPEWDFMSRTFLVLTLADQALADPTLKEEHLSVMDAIIEDTLATEHRLGRDHYLMPYARAAPFLGNGRSLFIDGEVLLMLNSRRMLQDDRWSSESALWSNRVVEAFGAGSTLSLAESYPDEGWMFCHTMAMVALRMDEVLDKRDHSALRSAWLSSVREHLIDPDTGMLVSEFDMRGRHHDGPEGSSIWLTATGLQLLDPELAEQQYALARTALGRSVLGMGYAMEWPAEVEGFVDVDSGPIIPVLDASVSSSGFSIAASEAFGDRRWNRKLRRALGAAELMMLWVPTLSEVADNPVGQSVVLWGVHFGPLWEAVGAPPAST